MMAGGSDGGRRAAERRVDRIRKCLAERGGRARLQQLLEDIRKREKNPDIPPQSIYIAIQAENERLTELGERAQFVTSRDGEDRGWVRLREASAFQAGTPAQQIEAMVQEQNARVNEEVLAWLQRMDWRTFESSFLTTVLSALGFEDVQITQATRDGGADARVTYRRGIVEARAIVSAKRWAKGSVGVEEVRMLRGIKGEEDTAIVVSTGRFTAEAREEARPGQNQRIVYLIDGERLVEICKQKQIGVRKEELSVLVLDEEVTSAAPSEEPEESREEVPEAGMPASEPTTQVRRRLRDSMLGEPSRGLSLEEVADLSGYSLNTVRIYLADARRKVLGDAIRANEETRERALALVAERRGANRPT